MKFHLPALAGIASAASASAFSFRAAPAGVGFGTVNLSGTTERDVFAMADWAASFGVQRADGLQLSSYDGKDYFPITQADIPAGAPVVYVPADVVLSSSKAAQEFGEHLAACEAALLENGMEDRLPLFRVFFKVLAEYEKGEASPYYPWLNSLPRTFNTGASMTYACFDCLPPYAAYMALRERKAFVSFQKAVRNAPFNEDVLKNVTALKWAYNVALTRSVEYDGERTIAPMADMFNHGAETEVQLSYDGNGDCYAVAQYDIPAGSPLRVSYGDPTDPTPLFARYGFLDESSPGTFCKLMHMREEMEALGYTYANLLFYRATGGISPEVYDVVLYYCLRKNDQGLADGFYQAASSGDDGTKAQYHEQYWQYTKEEMEKHVNNMLRDLDKWSEKANSYDVSTHPRVPLILQHNAFVKETFLNVKANLSTM